MTSDNHIQDLISSPEFQQRLAKHIALTCFRNSVLEDLHTGIIPDSAVGDYSDVVVKTPYGEIPWAEVSRINQEEMKALMQDVVNRTYRMVQTLFDEKRGGELSLKLAQRDPVPHWDTPQSG